MSDADAARAKVRQLLLSGDNTIKNKRNYTRARTNFAQARELVVTHDLGDELLAIIDRRIEGLPPHSGDEAVPPSA